MTQLNQSAVEEPEPNGQNGRKQNKRKQNERKQNERETEKKFLCVAIFAFVRYNVPELEEQCGFDHCSLIWFFFILLNPIQGKPAALTCDTGIGAALFRDGKYAEKRVVRRINAGRKAGIS